jgi:hypothetical protein
MLVPVRLKIAVKFTKNRKLGRLCPQNLVQRIESLTVKGTHMADERDLTKPAPAIAPAALAMPVQGMPMLPPGELIAVNKLTKGEQALLSQAGWKEGDPIPANFAELAEQARGIAADATDLDKMPPPADLTTPKLELPAEQDLSSLSAEEQKKYKMVMASVLSQAENLQPQQPVIEGADPSVLAAISAASAEPQLEIERPGPEPEPDKEPHEHTEEAGSKMCVRCGWPQSFPDSIVITNDDKDIFLAAVLGGNAFEKQYELFGGRMSINCRTLSPHEVDLCWRQIHADFKAGVVQTPQDQADRLQRYRAALQVTNIAGDSPWILPKSLAEWEQSEGVTSAELSENDTVIKPIWDTFSRILSNETLHRVIVGTVGEFNNLIGKLEVNANSPDFWTAADA